MKVHTNDNVVQNTLNSPQAYKIKASSKAFKILSEGLYSEKAKAPVRELSTNAYDAHIANGNDDVPFDVHLPNMVEPWFSIRDYGVGMSTEELETIYTTYFDSNKTHSNKFVGQMGLGSKTPFCVSDSFTVVSIKDGIKTTVVNYLDDHVPNFSIINTEDTTEPSGTEITFTPTNGEDSYSGNSMFEQLKESALQVFPFFDVTPNVTIGQEPLEIPQVDKMFKGTDWYALRQGLSYYDESWIIMGNVAYPFAYEHIDDIVDRNTSGWDETYEYRDLVNRGIVINVPIGKLDVTASRESIGWTDSAREYMFERVKGVVSEIREQVEDQLNSCKTFWDAKLMYNEMVGINTHPQGESSRGIIENFKWKKNLEWNEVALQDSFGNDYSKLPLMSAHNGVSPQAFWLGSPARKRNSDESEYVVRQEINMHLTYNENLEIYVDDLVKGHVARLRHYLRKDENKDKICLLVNPKNEYQLRKFRKFLTERGVPMKVGKVSSLEKPPRTSIQGSNKTNELVGYELDLGSSWWYNPRNNWSDVELDLTDTSVTNYYVPIKNWHVVNGEQDFNDHSVSDLIKVAQTIIGDEESYTILGIKKVHIKKVAKLSNWVNLFDLVSDYIKESVRDKTHAIRKQLVIDKYGQYKDKYGYKMVKHLMNHRKLTELLSVVDYNDDFTKDVKKIRGIVKSYTKAKNSLTSEEEDFVNQLRGVGGSISNTLRGLVYYKCKEDEGKKFPRPQDFLNNTYPMFKYMKDAIKGEGYWKTPLKDFFQYLKMIEKDVECL
jgi:hypothetical protein